MKNLTKVIATALVAVMALSSISVFAAEGNKTTKKPERPIFSMGMQAKGKKPEKCKMTEEEKTAKIEELKTKLTAKLEAGEITQEKYDKAIAAIENGEFMHGGKGGRGMKGEKPERFEMTEEEKAAKMEEFKADLAAKLEAGEIHAGKMR